MDTKNAYTISLSVRKIHIKLQPNAVVCITRTFFLHSALVWWLVVVGDSFFRVLLQLLFFSWNSALDFFSFHLHVCLICGLFCRNFFFIHRWICSVFWNLFLPDVPVLRVFLHLHVQHSQYINIWSYFVLCWIVDRSIQWTQVLFLWLLLKWISFNNTSHHNALANSTYWTWCEWAT